MPIEDYLSQEEIEITRHPPSRVRAMLRTVGYQLEVQKGAGRTFIFRHGRVASAGELLAAIDEALAEWRRLDSIIVEELAQRQRVAARISAFVEFYSHVRRQLRVFEGKRRRPLTAQQKVVAAAKLRETRKLRRTMGKRQRKALKA